MCEEKNRLVSEYEMATKKFSGAVTKLQRMMGTCRKSDYENLTQATDQARGSSEQARIALEAHLGEHGC